jgi:acyl transferase domain-containing protein/thioesterase domain-containing protein
MKTSAIAVVGMAGRFPGARNIDEFWRNLRDGVESIRPLSDSELLAAGAGPDELSHSDYVKAAAVLDDIDMFDASFFGFSPKDASIMDPQHRHFLECAWEAIESAGYAPESFSGSIGVFAGSGMNAYMVHNLLHNRRLMDSAGLFLIRQSGNDKDVLATRVSYQLDLRGPSMSVQTACSTSLVAVHLACQSLLNCECDMALAGGVTIEIPHARGYIYREGEILSRDGHCRAFDASSTGTVFSSGVGVVVLRRLEDAITDHDTIHAVILGSAVNNDGQRKVGYLAPSVAGQAEVIAEALGIAGATADSIAYVETHGTGTRVGDPIEIKALTQAFRETTDRSSYCAIGSLKTNVGHLDTAAGVAGLIKTTLALKHRQLPPSLHFHASNPEIDFPRTPFYVNCSLADWKSGGTPRRAGVTSLGIGGTNAHIVLEEAPATVRAESARPFQVIPLSAKTETALREVSSRLARHLRDNPDLRLADVAFTAQVGRKAFPWRRFIVASDTAEAARILSVSENGNGHSKRATLPTSRPVVFLFSGQGSQYPKMGADLYASEPAFRESLDRCAEAFRPYIDLDLREVLYPSAENASAAAEQLNRTGTLQPALFALEYALAQWWMAHGIRPQAMLGHSIGEYVAACIAEVLSLDDAVAITAVRGRLMQECAPGAMLAVSLSEQELSLPSGITLATHNAPRQCVVSGPTEAITAMAESLVSQGTACHRLQTSHAFHSPMMEPILESFTTQMRRVALREPRIPYLSNVTGTWIKAAEATDPKYWARHLRQAVRFAEGVNELLRQPENIFLEVGPGQTLASLVRQHGAGKTEAGRPRVFSSMRRREETGHDGVFLLNALGQLWVEGQTVNWPDLHAGEDVLRVPLPTYPFERRRFWIDPDDTASARKPELVAPVHETEPATPAVRKENLNGENLRQDSIDHWFYERRFSRAEPPAAPVLSPSTWMLFLDSNGLGMQIAQQLRGGGNGVVLVRASEHYRKTARDEYTIRPGVREDYDNLLADLAQRSTTPRNIVHLWNVQVDSAQRSLDANLDLSFYSLLFLAQAIGEQDLSDIEIAVVSDRLHSTGGESISDPVSATLLGPTRIIPQEFPRITCRNIDVDLVGSGAAQVAAQIIAEHSLPFTEPVVAIRGGERWIEHLERAGLRGSSSPSRLRQKGVYLITGGLGDLALVIAEELARSLKARLILLARTPLPPEKERQSALGATATPERIKQQIKKLIQIQSMGAEVLVVTGDVCHRDDVKRAIESGLTRFGSINGVIHTAGVLEDGPLQIKSRESAAGVLAPKVKGTLVLDEVLRDLRTDAKHNSPLDFIALFSSVSSWRPPAGQVDYAAANAFLDSFALSRAGGEVVAINWAPWWDVGMAARASSPHPLLGRRLNDSSEEIAYSAPLSCERHWVLAEHRMDSGSAVLPGTGYMEMALAALSHGSFDQGVEFEDVFFRAPFLADPRETRLARVDLRRAKNGAFQFSVRARETGWIEHASGQIARSKQPRPQEQALTEIAGRCRLREVVFDDHHRTEQEKLFRFGPRWRCLKKISLGVNEALVELELPKAFWSDTSTYNLHPALLDLATGAALYLIEGYGKSDAFYFPMYYQRAIFYSRIPSRFFSHIRSLAKNEAGGDVATFDLTLLDEKGRVLAEIEGFSMRLVRDPRDGLGIVGAHVSAQVTWPEPEDDERPGGIAPELGARAFSRILESGISPGIFVLPDGQQPREVPTIQNGKPKAEIAAPRDQIESVLTEWWQELLGHEQIGLDDDFFELGGQSLIVVRLFSKIKKLYGINFNLSTLFEAHTIRKLAALIRERTLQPDTPPKTEQAIVAIQPNGARLPLFVVSGLGGNVIEYPRLAFYLGQDQPIYGLIPRGLDGSVPFHTRVEEMAAYYVEAIRGAHPEGPYRLVGHSFGGTVAYEVARQLVAQGCVVSFLGLFDTIEWHYREQAKKSMVLSERLELYKSELKLAVIERDPFGPMWKRIKRKTYATISPLFQALGHKLRPPGATIEDVNDRAGASYEPKIYPGKLTLFRSTSRRTQDGDDEFLGWGGLVAGGIEVHSIPADHYNIIKEPAVRLLSEKLRECLDHDHVVANADHHEDALLESSAP